MRYFFIILLCTNWASGFAQIDDFDHIDFGKADSIAELQRGADLNSLPILAYELTADLSTDIEKFRSIYTWVCSNIEGDYSLYLKSVRNLEKYRDDSLGMVNWSKSFLPKIFESLREEKKTVCTGYAYLVKELSNFSGIECEIVDGYSITAISMHKKGGYPNHSWNAVRINGKWYLCDPTWSSGRFKVKRNHYVFISEYNDDYFLTDPKIFIQNHYPLDSGWRLIGEPPSVKTNIFSLCNSLNINHY